MADDQLSTRDAKNHLAQVLSDSQSRGKPVLLTTYNRITGLLVGLPDLNVMDVNEMLLTVRLERTPDGWRSNLVLRPE